MNTNFFCAVTFRLLRLSGFYRAPLRRVFTAGGVLAWFVFSFGAAGIASAQTSAGICDRSAKVRDILVDELQYTNVLTADETCMDVTPADLAHGSLTVLSMGRKNIASLKAHDFSGLHSLKKLFLHRNLLTSLPDGVFAGLTALDTLELDRNQLTRLPNNIFADLSSLRAVYLQHNKLTQLPAGIFSASPLMKVADFNNNSLTSLANDIFTGLTNMQTLDISENNLTRLPNSVFAGLPVLRTLRLDGNDLTRLPEGAFSGLDALTYVDASYNKLTGVPADLFAGSTALTTVHLNGNALTELPPRVFSGLTSLVILSLQGNQLTDLPAGIFSGLEEVRFVRLSTNALTNLREGLFSELPVLRTLTLNHNPFTALSPGVFSGTSYSLRVGHGVPDMPQNAVAVIGDDLTISWDAPMRGGDGGVSGYALRWKLKTAAAFSPSNSAALAADASMPVRISGNFTAGVEYDMQIAAISNYQYVSFSPPIDVGGNYAEVAILPVGAPQNVTAKPVVDNRSLQVSWNPPALDGDKPVRAYTVRWKLAAATSFSATDAAEVGGETTANTIANLESGEIYDVQVAATNSFGMGAFSTSAQGMPARGICGRTSQVQDAIILKLQSENVLDADETCADVGGDDVANHVLTELSLEAQSITELQSGDFAGLSAVHTLILHDNNLSDLPNDVFSDLPALRHLYLSGNNLANVREEMFTGIPALQSLYLSGNGLTNLPRGIFSGLPALQKLYLDVNRLTTLREGMFANLPALRVLSIHSNPYPHLQPGVFSGAPESVQIGNKVSGIPQNAAMVRDNTRLVVSWDAPLRAGDGGTTAYMLRWKPATAATFSPNDAVSVAANTTDYTIHGLSADGGMEYDVQVAAISHYRLPIFQPHYPLPRIAYRTIDIGGNYANVIVVPVSKPQHVTVTAVADNHSLGVSWRAPRFHDGQLINYTIRWKLESAEFFAPEDSASVNEVTHAHIIPNLEIGKTYSVQVAAASYSGMGLFSASAQAAPMAGICGRTQQVQQTIVQELRAANVLQSDETCADVSAADLANIGPDFSLSSQNISALQAGDLDGLSVVRNMHLDANDLTTLPPNIFAELPRLQTLRLAGNPFRLLFPGVFTGVSESLQENFGVPGVPRNAVATIGDNRITVSWNMPARAGAADVAVYHLRWKAASAANFSPDHKVAVRANQLAYTIGVRDGQYDMQIAAVNRYAFAGISSAIEVGGNYADVNILPVSIPQNVTVAPVADNHSLHVSWRAPVHNNGEATAAYTLRWKLAAAEVFAAADSAMVPGETTAHTITNLTSGETYDVQVAASNSAGISAFTLSAQGMPARGICGRTSPVKDAITLKLQSENILSADETCADVNAADLASINSKLSLHSKNITALQADDFAGLSALNKLELHNNALTDLPAGIFSELSALQTLVLSGNALTNLRAAIFSELSALERLHLDRNNLTVLAEGVFSGLSALDLLALFDNPFTAVQPGAFSGAPESAPRDFGVPGIPRNTAAVADDDRVVVSWDAPARAGNGGVTGYTLRWKLAAAATFAPDDSATATANAFAYTIGNLTTAEYDVQIAALGHYPFSDVASPINVGGNYASAKFLPVSAPQNVTLTAVADNRSIHVSWTAPAIDNGNAVTAYTLRWKLAAAEVFGAEDAAMVPADTTAATIANLQSGATYEVQVAADTAAGVGVFSRGIHGMPARGICGRTSQVQAAIINALSAEKTCAEITAADLRGPGLNVLSLINQNISALQAGDFAGMSNLSLLFLGGNALTSLPQNIFAETPSINTLTLNDNALTNLPQNIFAGLPALHSLVLFNNAFTRLQPGVFAGVPDSVQRELGVPSIPQNASAVIGASQLAVSWNPPARDAGVTNYQLRWKPSAAATFAPNDSVTVAADTADYTIGDLTAAEYDAQIAAIRNYPFGHAASAINVGGNFANVTMRLNRPQNVTATATAATNLEVSWRAVTSYQSNPVLKYSVIWKLESALSFAADDTATAAADAETHAILNLQREKVYEVRVAAVNGDGIGEYSATAQATPTPGICGRTAQVQAAIIMQTRGAKTCANITAADLANIAPSLPLHSQNIAALTTGDFSGLSSLVHLNLQNNAIAELPQNIFAGLSSLRALNLAANNLTNLPAGVFSELPAMHTLYLFGNQFSYLSPGVFTGVSEAVQQNLGVPGPPQNVIITTTVSANNRENLTMSWDAPAYTAGGIIAYNFRWKPADAAVFPPYNTAVFPASVSKFTLTGLINNAEHEVQIAAISHSRFAPNSNDASHRTPAISVGGNYVTAVSLPGVPQNVLLASADKALGVFWQPPAKTGGAALTYKLRWKPKTAADFDTAATTDTRYTIWNLQNGATYQVQIAAANQAGDGEYTPLKSAIPMTVPGAPQNLQVAASEGRLAISWNQPAADGGAPVMTYALRWTSALGRSAPQGFTADSAVNISGATNYTISGLAGGINYQVQIAAVNSAGAGEVSSAAQNTPVTPPPPPQNVVMTPGDESAGVSWDAPSHDGGAPVGTYTLRWKSVTAAEFAQTEIAPGTLTYVIGNLKNGATYETQIAAHNTIGGGDFSAMARSIPSSFTMNVDATKNAANASDAILIARGLLNVEGETLTAGQTAADSGTVKSNIELGKPARLDVDANGVDWRDGIMIARYALGIRGDDLIADLSTSPPGKLTEDPNMTPDQIAKNIEMLRK